MASVRLGHSYKKMSVIQASTQQDFCTAGEDYIVVSDCHGSRGNKNVLLDYMKNYNWAHKLDTDWVPEVLAQTSQGTAHAGATLTVFKIYPDRFECFWIGDSSGKIYCGDRVVFETKDHDYNHEDAAHLPHVTRKDIKILDARTATRVDSKNFTVDGENTNMTRCLGHRGLFHGPTRHFDHAVVPRTEAQYKVVAGSDGFWQMTCDKDTAFIADPNNDSDTLAEFASKRWHQAWDLKDTPHKGLKFPEDNIDDVCVAVLIP